MSVLKKALQWYGIVWHKVMMYSIHCRIQARCLEEVDLGTVTEPI